MVFHIGIGKIILLFALLSITRVQGDDATEATTTAAESVLPIVQISQGKLQGIEKLSRNGRTYFAFLGIPFGKSKRFQESELADGWNGVKDASKFGESCIQYGLFEKKIIGAEDCLFLNVYTPKISNETSLPVMVFIHGGGFQFLSGKLGGAKYFMDQDMILVMINYRLGPFGFVNTGHGANFGLKDQVLALKWVKKNIQNFGGDPNTVTIFGESAGAASVSFHIVSPLSKGLFHRAISQSGTSNAPWTTLLDPTREFRKLGILMDCPISNHEYLIECLKRIDATFMLTRIRNAEKFHGFRSEDIPRFILSVDKNSNGSVFLPDTPLHLMQRGEFERIPWITGVNVLEGLLLPGSENLKNTSRQSWNSKDAKALLYDEYDCKGIEVIRKFYVGDNKDAGSVSANITNLFSDRFFDHPAKVSAILHAKYAPTYLYYFSFKGEASFPGFVIVNKPDKDGQITPGHADELQYLFEYDTLFPEIKADSKFVSFSDYLVKLWVDFAKYGIISQKNMSSTSLAWTPLSNTSGLNDDIQWYNIDHETKMIQESLIFDTRLNFWNNLTDQP